MNRLFLIAVLTYVVALTGLAILNGPLLALALPLLALLGAALLFGPETPQLRIERTVDVERVMEHDPIAVTLEITNEGGRLELLRLKDGVPEHARVVEGSAGILTSLDAGEKITLEYKLEAPRGRYLFGPAGYTTFDFLLLFRRRGTTAANGHDEFSVLPSVPRLDRIPIRPRATKSFAGYIPARVSGTGNEFFGVRPYQRGDSLRHINWRANARYPGRFYTNEYEQERVADVGIILDARRSTYQIGQDLGLFEYAVRAAAGVADSFINDSNRVALLRYGDYLDWTLPGYGRIQRERILQALTRAEVGDSLVFENLENLPTRFFPPQSQIVMVSPLLTGDAEPLIRLRSRGYSLLIISPDPIIYEKGLLPDDETTRMAARIAQVERALLFRKLRHAGIQLMDWDVNIRLADALGRNLGRLRPLVNTNLPVGMTG